MIKGNEHLGTIITSKGRRFYDFYLRVDVMTRSRGSMGVIFRMVDPYNFLAFEFNIEDGYKRVIKSMNGTISVLKIIYDGGISQNNWFKILIKAQKNKFIIRSGDSKKYNTYNEAPIIFEFEDISFPKGE